MYVPPPSTARCRSLLGLIVAASFGSGDFLGGLASRRARTLAVLVTAQLCALARRGRRSPWSPVATRPVSDYALGALGGVLNVAALGLPLPGPRRRPGRVGRAGGRGDRRGHPRGVGPRHRGESRDRGTHRRRPRHRRRWADLDGARRTRGPTPRTAGPRCSSRSRPVSASASRSSATATRATRSEFWPVLSGRIGAVIAVLRGGRGDAHRHPRSPGRRAYQAIAAGVLDVGGDHAPARRHPRRPVRHGRAGRGAWRRRSPSANAWWYLRERPSTIQLVGPRARAHRARAHRRRADAPARLRRCRRPCRSRVPLRLAVVGLGQISELVLPTYLERDDVVIVGLCDRDDERLERWRPACPDARRPRTRSTSCSRSTPTSSTCSCRRPRTPTWCAGCSMRATTCRCRSRSPATSRVPTACSPRSAPPGATLRVLEDYLFFPPLVKLRDLIVDGEIGDPVSVHMKIVATGRGGWDLPPSSLEWQFEQARDGRGMMVFDHGWHQLAVATWLFGPIRRVFAWLGRTEIVPGIEMDAPSTLVWEHDNGVRAVLEISFADRHVLPVEPLHGRRAHRGHRHPRVRAHQPHQRAGDPGAGGGALPRRRDPRVPRPRRPTSRRVPGARPTTPSRSSGARSPNR